MVRYNFENLQFHYDARQVIRPVLTINILFIQGGKL